MQRRRTLHLCGSVLAASFAGCLTESGSPDETLDGQGREPGESQTPPEEAVDELVVEASFVGMVVRETEELSLSHEDDLWTGSYEASIEHRDVDPGERAEVVESLTENYGPDFEITTQVDGPEVTIDVAGGLTRQPSAVEALLESLVGLDSVETAPDPEDCVSKVTTYTVHGWADGTERIDARRDTCDTDLWVVDVDGDLRATLEGEPDPFVSGLLPR